MPGEEKTQGGPDHIIKSLDSCPGKKGQVCTIRLICNVDIRWHSWSNPLARKTCLPQSGTCDLKDEQFHIFSETQENPQILKMSLYVLGMVESCLFFVLTKAYFENEWHLRGRKLALWSRGVFDFCPGGMNIKKKKNVPGSLGTFANLIVPVPEHQPLAGFYLTAKCECSVH